MDTKTPPTPPALAGALPHAGPEVTPLRSIPPLVDSFPSSRKVEVSELGVPFRRISQSGGNPDVVVYDTTGPQGLDPRTGLPPRRAENV